MLADLKMVVGRAVVTEETKGDAAMDGMRRGGIDGGRWEARRGAVAWYRRCAFWARLRGWFLASFRGGSSAEYGGVTGEGWRSWLSMAVLVAYLRFLQGPPQRSSWPRVLRLPPNWYCLAVDLNMVKQFFPSPPPEEVNEV
ncbi:protein FORGETTER 1 isoform X1 [Sesbania bispinosa]|nr:protein FORGETTER 1 isoform X1 [Sesbania bispinosa]